MYYNLVINEGIFVSKKEYKKEYKQAMQYAEAYGVTVFSEKYDEKSTDFSDVLSNFNGVSIAYAPVLHGKGARMLEVAISYCAPSDKYKKKIGKLEAMKKFINGVTIQLPLAHLSEEEIKQTLLFSFYL